MSEERICVSCLARPPDELDGNLISTRLGWRLTRRVDARTNELVHEWRCPTCAARSRKLRALQAPPSGTFRAVNEAIAGVDEGKKRDS